jgi:LmbE family N-acetylglucosaminyl deacetylase
MAASLAAVGVDEHQWLGYPDGGCAAIDPARAVADLATAIQRVRPDVIVTFGPDGMTGHPDHRAVSAWVTTAWRRHCPAAQLWHATQLASFHERWGELNERIGIFGDAEPPSTDDADAVAVIRCTGAVLDAKVAALHAHDSQTAPLVEAVGEDTYRQWFSVEAFADGRPTARRAAA